MPRTGAQILRDTLAREGVTTVFGYPGGAILPAYDALLGSTIRHVLVRHEQAAVHMADGYARASGRVGVAVATSGPGATNMVTGIATAMLDSSPVLCITGQVASRALGSDAFQEVDIVGVTIPITKHNVRVRNADDVGPTVAQALNLARRGRPGPVLVDITKDAQQGLSAWNGDTLGPPSTSFPSHPNHAEIARAAALLARARRPVILAGQGVIQSGASLQLLRLAEKTNTPMAVTLLGIGGVPASHPLSLGMMGMHRVEQEDSVYPTVPTGAALDALIRRPAASALAETGSDR